MMFLDRRGGWGRCDRDEEGGGEGGTMLGVGWCLYRREFSMVPGLCRASKHL